MADLDGVWRVERRGGALPPMAGVTKVIEGASGETRLPGRIRMPFDVRGLTLRYRAPFAGLVDELERAGSGYDGRATFRGREFGQFAMRRIDVDEQLKGQLMKHLDEAHAMEQNVLRMLDGMISTTDDPEILDQLEHHKMETQRHADRMKSRLEAHGGEISTVRQATGILGALAKMPLDMVRREQAGRNARDAYATEHMEIASYELLTRIAQRAGDEETASAAREIIGDEEAMAEKIRQNWDKFTELSLKEEGITV